MPPKNYAPSNVIAFREVKSGEISKFKHCAVVISAYLLVSGLSGGCGNVELNARHSKENTEHSPRATPIDLSKAVKVVQKPLYVENGKFIEKQNAHSSKGLTEWFFHCYPEFEYKISSSPFTPNQATITITKVTLTISCPITVRVGNSNGPTIEHENGHVQIVKQIYEKAAPTAHDACAKVIGKVFKGQGSDAQEATSNALEQAGREVCKYYTDRTVLVVNELSQNYDDITQHGNAKISVPEAIEIVNEKYRNSGTADRPLTH